MNANSSPSQRKRQRPWLYWLLVCLVFRAAIPVGFMPGANAAWISLCWGNRGSAALLELAEHSAADHHGSHHDQHHGQDSHPEHSGSASLAMDGYCLFASVPVMDASCAADTTAGFITESRLPHLTPPPRLERRLSVAPPVRAPPPTTHLA